MESHSLGVGSINMKINWEKNPEYLIFLLEMLNIMIIFSYDSFIN